MSSALLIVVGLIGLVGGAELLVRGGTGLALRLGIAPIVIGVTVVSLGTSRPELAIGIVRPSGHDGRLVAAARSRA